MLLTCILLQETNVSHTVENAFGKLVVRVTLMVSKRAFVTNTLLAVNSLPSFRNAMKQANRITLVVTKLKAKLTARNLQARLT